MGSTSKSLTLGYKSHSIAIGYGSNSKTKGESAFSVTFGNYSLSETKGDDSVAQTLGYGSIVKAHHGMVSIVEYLKTDEGLVPGKTHSALVGGEILGIKIEPDKPYGFDNKGTFRVFTEEEVLEILTPSL